MDCSVIKRLMWSIHLRCLVKVDYNALFSCGILLLNWCAYSTMFMFIVLDEQIYVCGERLASLVTNILMQMLTTITWDVDMWWYAKWSEVNFSLSQTRPPLLGLACWHGFAAASPTCTISILSHYSIHISITLHKGLHHNFFPIFSFGCPWLLTDGFLSPCKLIMAHNGM